MCRLCDCDKYLKQGKEVVLIRATEIVQELRIAAQNVDDFEATEVISSFIAPFGSREDDVFRTAAWVSRLHDGAQQGGREQRYAASVRAFEDIFSRLPVQGEQKGIATAFHQLEQLCRDIDEGDLTSIGPEARQAILAVKHVHDNMEVKVVELKARYGLVS